MESIYLLVGQSVYLINEQVKKYQSESSIDAFNTVNIDALETSLDEILRELQTVSFFSETKMVIIEHVDALTRYDDYQLEPFYKYLESPSEDIKLIMTMNEVPKAHQLSQYLEKYAFIETIKSLEGSALPIYLNKVIEKDGYKMDGRAIELLIDRTSGDLFLCFQEIEKLKAYKVDEKHIVVDDVELLVTRNLEDNIFAFSSAYLKNDIKNCIKIYEDLVTGKTQTSTIFNHLYQTVQWILQTQLLINRNLSQQEIASELNISSGRAYHLIREAKTQSKKRLEQLIIDLSKLDVEIKTGQTEEKIGFELLLLRGIK